MSLGGTERLRTGVWIGEDGFLFRRDSPETPNVRVYRPVNPKIIEKAATLLRILYFDSQMDSWTAQIEAWNDKTREAFHKLAREIT